MPFIIFFSLLFLFHYMNGGAEAQTPEMDQLLQEGFTEGITVDLREPIYSEGILMTDKGGVITAPHLRIQAKYLCYTRKLVEGKLVWTIEAEGDLIVEFGEYLFVGDKLFYDFQKREGVIDNGKTAVEPWHFGGERIELRPDGSYLIYNGYITTSEKDPPDWAVCSKVVHIENDRSIQAENIQVRIFNYSILWIPSLRANLNSIFDSPIRYRFRWGGRQGTRFGLTYEIFSWGHWKTFIRFDYRLARGPGGGIETRYHSEDRKTEFRSINYMARDSSILQLKEKARYRFEGMFRKLMDEDKTSLLLTYDKISDRDMPSSYYDRDFDLNIFSERTQLRIRRQEERWIGNFYTRVRVNSFQTVKQELPTLEIHPKPFQWQQTGFIFNHWGSVSYLDFKYSTHLLHVHDYASSRVEYRPTLYRPFVLDPFLTWTPEVGAITIFYGNSPHKDAQLLALGKVGWDLNTQLYRHYGSLKHVIEPYAFYRYYSFPTSSPHHHFIFDIEDGWTRLNYLSFGIKNALYAKRGEYGVSRILSTDLYTYAFFDTHKIHQTIPKMYGRIVFFPTPTLKHIIDVAWDLEHHQLGHLNVRSELTFNANLALAFEYRHRNSFDWRKVDPENFFLDMFHSEKRLRHSALSDRRDTLLLHAFYRFHPNWACEISSRQGWNRLREPSYLEYEIDLLTTIQTAWNLRFSFQHRENDNRFVMYLNMGQRRPDKKESPHKVDCYD